MARYVAEVADGLVRAISSQMAGLPAIVAGFFVGAVGGDVALLVAVVAESQIARRKFRVRALSCTVARLPAGVADAFVGALAG